MGTECRSGRTARVVRALLPLLFSWSVAAAAPLSSERAYRDARASVDRADLNAALAKANAALAQLGAANDEWTWSLRILRAEVLIKQRNAAEGLAIVTPELPPALRTREVAVRRMLALGFAAFPDRARTLLHFRRAMEIAVAHQPRLVFDVHLALGNVTPFPEAERHLKSAIALARERGDTLGVANAKNALSRLCTQQELYARAVEAGEEAVALYERLGVSGRLSSALGNLGWAYEELGDFETAADLFRRAEAAAKAAGSPSERIVWWNQLGNIELTARRFAEAGRYYRQAVDLARSMGSRSIGDPLTNLARVAVETGRLDEAKRYNDDALAAKRALKDRDAEQTSLIVEARIAMLSGDAARAERTLRRVIAEAVHDATKWEAQAWLAQLYARLDRAADADAQYRQAIETAGAARRSIGKPELRLPFFNLADRLFDSYVDFLVGQRRVEDALAVTERARAETLEEVRPSPRHAVDARALARQTGATLLAYWLGRSRSLVWVITPSSMTVYPLPADVEIERAVAQYRRDLEGVRGTLHLSGERGEALYRMLVGPASRSIARGSRVIVVADGALHSLNFETLVVPSPRRYWIEDVVVMNASSLQLLAGRPERRTPSATMLLVGNPPAPGFPPLPLAAAEMRNVARRFDRPTVLDGSAATPAAYRAAAPGKYEFVHFVAHAVAARKRPLDSAVILARDGSGEYKLFARDLLGKPIHARLVTISSCHGAGTRAYSGEGLVGLAWAFLQAGAGQVIAALWEVDDRATPGLMDRMYAAIRAGRDPAVALREAKLALVRGSGAYRKPVYWAPFVLYAGAGTGG